MNLYSDVSISQSLLCIVFFGILVVISILDLLKMKISNYLCTSILAVGIISIFFIKDISIIDRFMGFFVVSVPMFFISILFKKGFGGGDIKFVACAGVFLGWELILLSTFLALIFTGIFIIISLIVGDKSIKSGFALGPFLSIGMIMSCTLGRQIMQIMF